MPKLKMPSPAMIVAVVALVLSLGGNAFAVTQGHGGGPHHKISKGEIAKGAVTAASLAKGAVTPAKLAPESVTPRALKKGAVGGEAIAQGAVGPGQLAPDSVTAGAIAPGSIYAPSLAPITVVSAPIKDLDETADLSNWTNSSTVTAACPANDKVISGSTTILNPGNRRVAPLTSAPVLNGVQGWTGSMTSDSGGLAEGAVDALCLTAGP